MSINSANKAVGGNMEISEIVDNIAANKMTPAAVFTQMKQHIRAARAQAIGWAYADVCAALDNGQDPRTKEMPDVLERANRDLG